MTCRGHIEAGAIILDEPADLPEGARIIPADDASFRAGLELYSGRPDKEWSFIDCVSMAVMHSFSLTDVLTVDRHFQQAGFKALLL